MKSLTIVALAILAAACAASGSGVPVPAVSDTDPSTCTTSGPPSEQFCITPRGPVDADGFPVRRN